jgi:hypothetical protein
MQKSNRSCRSHSGRQETGGEWRQLKNHFTLEYYLVLSHFSGIINFIAEPALFWAGYFFLKSEDFSLGAPFIFKFECPSFKFQWWQRKNLHFQTSSKKCRLSDKIILEYVQNWTYNAECQGYTAETLGPYHNPSLSQLNSEKYHTFGLLRFRCLFQC